MHNKRLITLLIGVVTIGRYGIALAQTPARRRCSRPPGSRAPISLYLPLPEPPGDVHRHPGGRDRHRSDQLWPAAGGENLSRGNRQDHQGAGQISDLQPPPLRSHRRRQALQGCRSDRWSRIKRARERLAVLKGLDFIIPDETVERTRAIKLGGTTLELPHIGRNHSDSSLVMFLPRRKSSSPSISMRWARCRRGWRSTISIRSNGKPRSSDTRR